jgi:alpha-mannosidase
VDWRDQGRRVRVCFPAAFGDARVFSEVPYGVVERAPGPIPVLGWLEVAERDLRYGLALVNTGTPSYEVAGGRVCMTLFRSIDPDNMQWRDGRDKDCDWCMKGQPYVSAMERGARSFSYALVPHAGSWRSGLTYRHALEFSNPLAAVATQRHRGGLPPERSFVALSPANLVLSCLKRSSARDGVVARCYEIEGKRTVGTLSLSFPFSEGYETNLIEEGDRRIDINSGRSEGEFGRFEIRTTKLEGLQGSERAPGCR